MSIRAFETTTGEKQTCRELICILADAEIGYANVKKIFTLPSKEALCYSHFKRHYPKAKIACIERDPEICQSLWNDKNIDCTQSTIRDYANHRVAPEQHHDIVFLDYYSFLSEEILKDIHAFVQNDNILHPGKPFILAITLAKGMRAHKDATIKHMEDYLYKGDRSQITNTLENVSLAIKNYIACEFLDFQDIALIETREYQAQAKSTSMYFMVLSIKK